MPGILPMKVIKVGTTAQARIAQACDRCRSKKIRCDGIRPSCTQCINVGFECKTSDKLSRRAFPRGYTESLEERVRQLELEVRELKDLLDEKEEKIDVLSKIRSGSPRAQRKSIASEEVMPEKPSFAGRAVSCDEIEQQETMRISPSTLTGLTDKTQSSRTQPSSLKIFAAAFRSRIGKSAKSSVVIDADKLCAVSTRHVQNAYHAFSPIEPPPRMLSDQLINIFFQQWAPLYPVLQHAAFLDLYQEYTAAEGRLENETALARLYLVFAIAAESSQIKLGKALQALDNAWRSALTTNLHAECMGLLQCLALAMIRCLQQADNSSLSRYRSMAVGLLYRLGLDKSFDTEEKDYELKTNLLHSISLLDSVASAQLSVSTLMSSTALILDETTTNIMSDSSVAVSQAAQIIREAVTMTERAKMSQGLPVSSVNALAEQLDTWYHDLPPRSRMLFMQDKPSTHLISSQSPIISILYYYARSLIYRLPLCCDDATESSISTATTKLAESAKRLTQLMQLLEERGLSFAFPINKAELLVSSGFGILLQSMDVADNGALMKDYQRSLAIAYGMLTRIGAPVTSEFRRVSSAIASTRSSSSPSLPPPQQRARSRDEIIATIAPADQGPSRTNSLTPAESPLLSRHPSYVPSNPSPISATPRTDHPRRLSSIASRRDSTNLDYLSFGSDPSMAMGGNLNATLPGLTALTEQQTHTTGLPEWERLISSLDIGNQNIFDGIYGASQPTLREPRLPPKQQHQQHDQAKRQQGRGSSSSVSPPGPILSIASATAPTPSPVIQLPHGWHLSYEESTLNVSDDLTPAPTRSNTSTRNIIFDINDNNANNTVSPTAILSTSLSSTNTDLTAPAPRSVLSFSDESITSGSEEFTDLTSPIDVLGDTTWGGIGGVLGCGGLTGGLGLDREESYASITIPHLSEGEADFEF